MDKPLEERELNDSLDEERAQSIVARILARRGTALESTEGQDHSWDAGMLEREARAGTRRIQSQRNDREDISEVEYRQIRLERVVLVGLRTTQSEEEVDTSLRELAALAETAGSQVLDAVVQKRVKPDPATYLGSGKAKELADIVRSVEADTVIVDEELTPSQRRGLEDVIDAKVVDRTALILDIFAQHAKSREGKAQVELAQLEYLLPRLRGWGESMSRQAGGRVAAGAGIGSRGPGETKIELDRRRIRTRMAKLREEIRKMEPARRTQRLSRRRGAVPSVAILGYTNAGKSTLLNQLTDAGVLVEDALFATLDPTVRRTETVDGRAYTLTDTVGFVRNLPTQLVEAFRSTLEEVGEADLLVHVVDAAHPDPVGQVEAVRLVLADIEGASSIPEIIVLNKADLASPEHLALVRTYFPEAVVVSANTGLGIDVLRHRIEEALPRPSLLIDCVIPYSRGDLVHTIHEEGEVEREEYVSEGTRVIARVNERLGAHIKEAGIVLIGVGGDSFAGAGSLEQALSIGAGSLEGTMPDKREGFEGAVPKRMESPKGSLDD
ncbi:GTP-binding protein [Schaalia cardiffensis F0333]|uniref:GTPase HflX n=1 Tax=Schaalia cardiffensis F0333 TaxID=888050 RepID=N6XDE3_9ACTO|nr:GTPase HflX [Schaalia cardiffensis]ENO19228.1 GTP-binding protein [Schaalia cardiffensis F0333]